MSRAYVTLLPAIGCFVYFVGGVPVYWLKVRRAGFEREPRIEARRPSALIPKWLIYYLFWSLAPIERALIGRRVSPNLLSAVGLGLSLLAGVTLAGGWFDVGGWLYLFAGIVDLFDGRVARATGRVSNAGAFFDSILDRYAESCVLAGLLFWWRASWIASLVLLAWMGSLMVSYVRARGDALGVGEIAEHGAMQRPERIFLLGVALAASPFAEVGMPPGGRPLFVVAAAAVAVLAVTSHVTAVSRARLVFRALRATEPVGTSRRTQDGHPRVSARRRRSLKADRA
jgi:phosphatidylglycerophosphate synthase